MLEDAPPSTINNLPQFSKTLIFKIDIFQKLRCFVPCRMCHDIVRILATTKDERFKIPLAIEWGVSDNFNV